MDPSDVLTKETILAALHRLDELLRERGIIGEICIFGGAAMVLAFDARESTREVDAVFVPKDHVLDCAKLVASEFGLNDDWMNNEIKGFISDKAEVTHEGMPVFDNLRVVRPTTEYLLAMKCLTSRSGPKSDLVICKLVLVELYMQLRSPRVFSKPQTPAAAAAYCQTLRSTPGIRHIDYHPAVLQKLWKWAAIAMSGIREIIDARLALTLRHHGVTHFATANVEHFENFGFTQVWNPLLP